MQKYAKAAVRRLKRKYLYSDNTVPIRIDK